MTFRRLKHALQRTALAPLRSPARASKATLLNTFPAEIAADAAQAHQRLRQTFDYTPTTLEMEAERRCSAQVQEAA